MPVKICTRERNLNSVDLSSPIFAQQYNNSRIPRTMGSMRRLKRYKTGVNECLHTTYTTISWTMAAKLRPASGGHCTYLVSIIGITISEKLSRQQTEQNSIRLLLYTGPSNFLGSRWKYRSEKTKWGGPYCGLFPVYIFCVFVFGTDWKARLVAFANEYCVLNWFCGCCFRWVLLSMRSINNNANVIQVVLLCFIDFFYRKFISRIYKLFYLIFCYEKKL